MRSAILSASKLIYGYHWRIQGGGCAAAHAPPQQDQFLSFSHTFSLKSVSVGGWRPPNGSAPPQREILDPPLVMNYNYRWQHRTHHFPTNETPPAFVNRISYKIYLHICNDRSTVKYVQMLDCNQRNLNVPPVLL